MTKTDFDKAMKKLAEENYQLTQEELDLEDKISHLAIKRRSINRRGSKLEKEFMSEQQPDLSIIQ